MNEILFSLLVWTKDTNEYFFRDLMESVVAQSYQNWELFVLDENSDDAIKRVTSEFFPNDKRVHYRRIKNVKGQAYAYNIGFHFVLQEAARRSAMGYVLFTGQHDRLSPNSLEIMASSVVDYPGVLYTDHDLLIDGERMYPLFKTDLNIELFRHRNYVGDFFAVSYEAVRTIGEMREILEYAWAYDYILRAIEAGIKFQHIPQLLYHQRLIFVTNKRIEKRAEKSDRSEHMAVLRAHFKRLEIDAEVGAGSDPTFWNVNYNGEGAIKNQKDYLLLRDAGVRPISRNNVERMYSYIKQDDVAIVGARFFKSAFTIENCGYIFNTDGISFPAFYERKSYQATYQQLAVVPRDVSAVDGAYCMINAKVYRKLGGFNSKLVGRDIMLDFCLKAKEAGYRTVVVPQIMAFRGKRQAESTEESNQILYKEWEEVLKQGDPYYNPNLPVGLNNYSFF